MLPKGTLEHAAKIRHTLIAGRVRANKLIPNAWEKHPTHLGGACGLASVLLCLALGDAELKYLRGSSGHAWNVFPFPSKEKELIVDITATQFNHELILLDSGVYLGTRPQKFHCLDYYDDKQFLHGREVFEHIQEEEWYVTKRTGATIGEIRRWRKACRELTTVPTAQRATKG